MTDRLRAMNNKHAVLRIVNFYGRDLTPEGLRELADGAFLARAWFKRQPTAFFLVLAAITLRAEGLVELPLEVLVERYVELLQSIPARPVTMDVTAAEIR